MTAVAMYFHRPTVWTAFLKSYSNNLVNKAQNDLQCNAESNAQNGMKVSVEQATVGTWRRSLNEVDFPDCDRVHVQACSHMLNDVLHDQWGLELAGRTHC